MIDLSSWNFPTGQSCRRFVSSCFYVEEFRVVLFCYFSCLLISWLHLVRLAFPIQFLTFTISPDDCRFCTTKTTIYTVAGTAEKSPSLWISSHFTIDRVIEAKNSRRVFSPSLRPFSVSDLMNGKYANSVQISSSNSIGSPIQHCWKIDNVVAFITCPLPDWKTTLFIADIVFRKFLNIQELVNSKNVTGAVDYVTSYFDVVSLFSFSVSTTY